MSFDPGIPDLKVIIREASNDNLSVDVPNISVKLQQDAQYNVSVTPSSVTPFKTGSFSSYADIAGTAYTASYALVAQTLIGSVQSASFAYTASNILGGAENYIPVWSSNTTLSSSLLYQTGSSVLLGATTQHTPEAPDTFGVFAGETTSYNLISAHGTIDDYLQVNLKNFSSGSNASTDLVATTDTGDESGGYINLGINSSGYNIPGAVGNALDGYLYVTGSDLLIGNVTPDKKVIIFAGGENAADNARVYIDSTGTVGINTTSITAGDPESLYVGALNTSSINLITAVSNVNNYSQFNLTNQNAGTDASADVVATADNGTETANYIDMGINSSAYNIPNQVGMANDAYLYSTGQMLHIGNATEDQKIMFFAGGIDAEANNKLTLDANNNHELTGSLTISGSLNAPIVTGSLYGTASWAQNAISSSFASTASYALNAGAGAGFPYSGSAVITGSLFVSGSGITGSLFGTASWAQSSSVAVSSSFSVTSSRATTSSFAITSSYSSNADLLDGLNSTIFATTGSNTFVGNQIITGSLLTNADTLIFTGSMFTTGSMSVTGSINVSGGITGSLLGSSSYALTSSYIDGGLY